MEALERRCLFSGVFLSATLFDSGMTVEGVVTGDFNGDGKLDMLARAEQDGSEQFLAGNGDGTFAPPVSAGFSGTRIATGDFNHDGKTDAAATQSDGTIDILSGNGDGTFAAVSSIDLGDQISATVIGAADFDNDGKTDLVIVQVSGVQVSGAPRSTDTRVEVLKGDGAGGFQLLPGTPTPPLAVIPIVTPCSAVGDFNGDGNVDVVAVSQQASLEILLGDGNGGLLAPQVYDMRSGGPAAVADFNHDGFDDLVVSVQFVAFGSADGLSFANTAALPQGTTLAVADVNGDGFADLLVNRYVPQELDVVINRGDGTFEPPATQVVPVMSFAPPVVGDFNGDGRMDVLLPSVRFRHQICRPSEPPAWANACADDDNPRLIAEPGIGA